MVFKKKEIDYYEVYDIYKRSNIFAVYKKVNLLTWFLGLVTILLIINISAFIFVNDDKNFILIISGIIFFVLTYFIVKMLVKKFKKIFPRDKRLIEKDGLNWMGCRYILFRNELKKCKFNQESILSRIEYEIDQNNMTFIHKPSVIILITTLTTSLVTFITIFITKYFELIYFEKYKNFDLLLYCVIINVFFILFVFYVLPIRTKNMKLREFKYFIELFK